jgi:prepilin-type N-terminal cleavage/methylation domain-containing protein
MNHKKGFSLLEMMLVLVILSALMAVYIQMNNQKTERTRRENLATQMEQILAASMAYYSNSTMNYTTAPNQWPPTGTLTSTNVLVTSGYLPANFVKANYYNSVFTLSSNTTSGTFSVSTTLQGPLTNLNKVNAGIIASLLPLGISSGATVTGTVNTPGQALNNAIGIHFAGIYNAMGCVPAPTCPLNMSPVIYVAPVSVNGDYTMPQYCSSSDPTTCVPTTPAGITSYVAFAVGGPNNVSGQFPYTSSAFNPGTNGTIPNNQPTIPSNMSDCPILNAPTTISCFKDTVDGSGSWITDPNKSTTQLYWRVCLSVMTTSGLVDPNRNNANFTSGNNTSAQQGLLMGQVAAFTGCAPNGGNQTSGTPLNIWTFNGGNKD